MFALTAENTFHLYNQPTDMRKSFDALSGLVRNNLGYDPIYGAVFIFINKSRDKIKLLHWEGSGYLLYYKRLEKGTFELPRYDASVGSITLSYAQMVMIMDGLSIRNLQKRMRYTPAEVPVNQGL
jgi:transposase